MGSCNSWQKLALFTNGTKIERSFCWTYNFGIQKKQRSKNLRDIIGGNKVLDNKKVFNVYKFNKGKCSHVLQGLLIYVVKNSKVTQPFKVPLTKTPFQSDITSLVKADA